MRYLLGIVVLIYSLLSGEIVLPTTFSANFVQKVTNSRGKVLRYKGKIYMTTPDRIKWVYNSPTKKEVCSNSKIVTVVDHDLEQVSFYRLDKSFILSKLLKNAKHYRDNLYTTKYQNRLYTIALNSKGQVEQIAYRDDMDNIVNIHFFNIKYSNKALEDKDMSCPYPNSYDIVEG